MSEPKDSINNRDLVAIVALVVGSLALGVSLTMYSDLYNFKQQFNTVRTESMEITDDVVTQTQQAIIAAGSQLDQTISQEEFINDLVQLRENIAEASQTSTVATQQQLQEIDNRLGEIESQARSNSAQAIDTFQQYAEQLEQDLRTDETS